MLRSTEAALGRLGAVLSAARTAADPVRLTSGGPWLAATQATARDVLTDPHTFDFPMDVARRPLATGRRRTSTAPGARSPRTPHSTTAPLTSDQVARGRAVLAAALARITEEHRQQRWSADAMTLLRKPLALAVCTAVLPPETPEQVRGDVGHQDVADAVLQWIDALAPVIASNRNPSRWGGTRRAEARARRRLHELLAAVGVDDPDGTATVLAAGIQVPIAAAAWLLVHLATNTPRPDHRGRPEAWEPVHVVWETLRLTPPTWVTARLATVDTALAGELVTAGSIVLVSPLQLGQSPTLVPHDAARPLDVFDPHRWRTSSARPGAWLPFGAGPHACPGRSLGIALLTEVAQWAGEHHLEMPEPARIDQSRGLFPTPSELHISTVQKGPS